MRRKPEAATGALPEDGLLAQRLRSDCAAASNSPTCHTAALPAPLTDAEFGNVATAIVVGYCAVLAAASWMPHASSIAGDAVNSTGAAFSNGTGHLAGGVPHYDFLASPLVWDHPEPNFVISGGVAEFWSALTAIPLAGGLLLFTSLRYRFAAPVLFVSGFTVWMYNLALLSHATLNVYAFRVTLTSVMANAIAAFFLYGFLAAELEGLFAELECTKCRAKVAVFALAVVATCATRLPEYLGPGGGVKTLFAVQAPPVWLASGLAFALSRSTKREELRPGFRMVAAAGFWLSLAMLLSLCEVLSGTATVLSLRTVGFPALHIAVHVSEQIGIYLYGISVAFLHHVAVDPRPNASFKWLFAGGSSDAWYAVPYFYSGAGVPADERQDKAAAAAHAAAAVTVEEDARDREALRSRLEARGAAGNAAVDVEDLLDPAVRRFPHEFNRFLFENFAARGGGAAAGERGAGRLLLPVAHPSSEPLFLAFRHADCQDVLASSDFSGNPYPDGRLLALNTMDDRELHKRLASALHPFYSTAKARAAAAARVDELLGEIKAQLRGSDSGDGAAAGEVDIVPLLQRFHMRVSFDMMGCPCDEATVRRFVRYNRLIIELAAPLGGVGEGSGRRVRGLAARCADFASLAFNLARALPATLRLACRLGPAECWKLLRPDATVLFPPTFPASQTWSRSHCLPSVPLYFLELHQMSCDAVAAQAKPGAAPSPLAALAGCFGGRVTAEVLAVGVQLMVNMTTANLLANLLHRLMTEPPTQSPPPSPTDAADVARYVAEVTRLDASLQRNPRRAVSAANAYGLPAGATVLVLLGAGNCDPAVFGPDASTFRPARALADGARGGGFTYGVGRHSCLGRPVVQAEMQLLCERFVAAKLGLRVVRARRVDDVDVGNSGFESLVVASAE
jgi:cytochrome P450